MADSFDHHRLTRRQLLRLAAAGGVIAALPIRPGRALAGGSAPAGEFLTANELALVDAISARIIPTDTLPGAREAGVAEYIQGLLSALPPADANQDRVSSAADLVALARLQSDPAASSPLPAASRGDLSTEALAKVENQGEGSVFAASRLAIFSARPIFAGGPFSGRTPFGDFEAGGATDRYPGNSFESHIPLNRVQRLAWKVRLDGATEVPEVAGNPLAQSLAEVDLRRKYRDGLAAIDAASRQSFGVGFRALTPAQQDQVLQSADQAFVELVTGHTVEGMFCAPEYGGNRNQVGWQLIGFDGDSQPLGYTLGFDERTQAYIERADKPNSLPDPTETCAGFSANVVRFLSVIILAEETQPAKRFTRPFCFGAE